MQAAAPALAIHDLTARLPVGLGLRKRTILEGVNLRLAPGEGLGLLGPNGSGKTTLIRHLAGLLRPAAGSVRLFGSAAHDPKALARVTYLPEDSPFPKELTGPSALALLASLRGQKGAQARSAQAAALDRAGLSAHVRTPLGRYSRGMLRRFGLAQAFLFQPDLVLLDEPTAGLDAPGLLMLEEWLVEHRERGGSLVLCSHSLSDLVQHTDRVAILWEGRLAAQGATQVELGASDQCWVQWRKPSEPNADASLAESVERFLTAAGATQVRSGPVWKSLFEVYRGLSRAQNQDATAGSDPERS